MTRETLLQRVEKLEAIDNDRIASECRTTLALQQRIQALEMGMGAPRASDSELHQSVSRLQVELLESRCAVTEADELISKMHHEIFVKDESLARITKERDNAWSDVSRLRGCNEKLLLAVNSFQGQVRRVMEES